MGQYSFVLGVFFFYEDFLYVPQFFLIFTTFDYVFASLLSWFLNFYDIFFYNFNSSFVSAFFYFDFDFLILFDFTFFTFFYSMGYCNFNK